MSGPCHRSDQTVDPGDRAFNRAISSMKYEDLVLSDVHLELPHATVERQSHVTQFWIRDLATAHAADADVQQAATDDDGDLILARRFHVHADSEAVPISIAHLGATALADVGMQIWRGECLITEYLLLAASNGDLSQVKCMLELGGGTGMACVVAAHILSTGQQSQQQQLQEQEQQQHQCEEEDGPGDVAVVREAHSSRQDCPAGLELAGNGDPAALGPAGKDGPAALEPARRPPVPQVHIFCTDHHTPSLHAALANLYANLPCSLSRAADGSAGADHPSDADDVLIHGPANGKRHCARRQAARSPAVHAEEVFASGAESSGGIRVDGNIAVHMRRLDWMDFAAVRDGQDAGRAVAALLIEDTEEVVKSSGSAESCRSQIEQGVKGCCFKWREEDLKLLEDLDMIIAGDVVYDETLTEAMLKTAAALLQHASGTRSKRQLLDPGSGGDERLPPRLILAMEKRWCFTLRDLDSRAPAFDHFCSLVDVYTSSRNSRSGGSGASDAASGPAGDPTDVAVLPVGVGGPQRKLLSGRRLDVETIPQRLQGYERGPDLELWELSLLPD